MTLIKCLWKEVLERGLKDGGTTFKNRTKEDLRCYECDGMPYQTIGRNRNLKCDRYTPIREQKK